MATGPIPFGDGAATGLSELGGASPFSINVLKEPGTKWCHPAPGTSSWNWFPSSGYDASPVVAISSFRGKLLYITQNATSGVRKLWCIETPGLITACSDSSSATQLGGSGRPVFAVTKSRVFIAGGAQLLYWAGTGLAAQVSSGPTAASFVLANAQRVIAPRNDNTGEFVWTDPLEGNHLTGWDELNFAEAEARPDRVVAAGENSDELFLFGEVSTQSFRPDSVAGYAPSYTLNSGIGPAHSLINCMDLGVFAWITNKAEVVMSDARGEPKKISDPQITRWLREQAEAGYTANVFGWRMEIGAHDLLCWAFPDRTIAYDIKTETWADLRGYSAANGTWAALPVSCYFHWEEQGVHLVGLSDGTIVKLDDDAETFAGQTIVCDTAVGFNSRGTDISKKQTGMVAVPMKRGLGTVGVTPPWVELRWRDNPGAWSQPVPLSIGDATDQEPVARRRIVTRPYVRREWRLTMTKKAGWEFGPGEEVYDLLSEDSE